MGKSKSRKNRTTREKVLFAICVVFALVILFFIFASPVGVYIFKGIGYAFEGISIAFFWVSDKVRWLSDRIFR